VQPQITDYFYVEAKISALIGVVSTVLSLLSSSDTKNQELLLNCSDEVITQVYQ